jgi:hypothetical protein
MASKRATKSDKRVKNLQVRRVSTRTAKSVKGGAEPTKHPAKVTVPDLK